MNMSKILSIILGLALFQSGALAQQKDSALTRKDSAALAKQKSDSLSSLKLQQKKKHDPHKATIYSAILPGAGQVYNGKFWKVPIVYAALGISAYAFFYNKSWYEKCQYALAVANGGPPVNQDSLKLVDPKLQGLASQGSGAGTYIINYRNDFRKNQDYAALFFLLFWGLNIVDATVDAHLKDFNVNSDLSFRIKPAIMPAVRGAGISLVFDIHKGKPRAIDIRN
ncbi:MAG: DUF5683 domain-containing protein [Chitinophagales bacterium]